jgi:hypothetical protein
MTNGKTPNLKQCSTMNQQRQTSLDNFGQIVIYFIYTHPQFGANEDSWKLWQQLKNWARNLWKHRSQLIFAKTAKTVFKSAQLLLVHSIFFGVYWFFWALFMLWLWKTPLKKSLLWGFNLPPHYWGTTLCHLHPFSKYSSPKSKEPYPRPRCAYRLKLLI